MFVKVRIISLVNVICTQIIQSYCFKGMNRRSLGAHTGQVKGMQAGAKFQFDMLDIINNEPH